MTKRILNAVMVLAGAGSVLAGCNFDQPEPGCFVQDSTAWVAKYDPIDDPKTAAGVACAVTAPSAEQVGIYKFVNPDVANSAIITLRPAGLASRGARDPGDPSNQTATGAYASEPDGDDFCAAPTFSVATVDAAATASAAATQITYEFKNLKVYSAPSTPGTQFTGELKYTRDGCISNYIVRGMWPAVGCDPESSAPADTCGAGSGLNPDFAATCDEASGFCVPAKAIPSFN